MKTGRNDLCPCGSGQKFKRCHARDARHAGLTEPVELEYLQRLWTRLGDMKGRTAQLVGYIEHELQRKPTLVLADVLRELEIGRDALFNVVLKLMVAEELQVLTGEDPKFQNDMRDGFCMLDVAAERLQSRLHEEAKHA